MVSQVANRNDIGVVGEITGTSYKITATATRPGDGRATAKIVADIMIEAGTIHIASWQISNQRGMSGGSIEAK